jgi:uncharacterized protein involved in outer membrane biogenesis
MPKGLKRTLVAALLAVGLYSLLGFLILPGIALHVANQQLAKYVTQPAKLERLEFNPFSLELSLHRLHLGESGAEQLAFHRLYANLQWSSLWRGVLYLADLELEGPRIELLFDEDGQLNLAALFRLPESTEPDDQPPGEPLALHIGRLQLSRGDLHFQDLRPGQPIDYRLSPIDLELLNLSTLPNGQAEARLHAAAPHGGRLDWRGDLSLRPLASNGHLELQGLRLSNFWPYVRDALPLVLEKGQLDLASDYRLDLAEGLQLKLSKTRLDLTGFAVQTPDQHPLLRLEQLSLGKTTLDLAKREVVVGSLRSQGLETWAAREADGNLDWQKLFARPSETPTAKPKADTDGQPWQVRLKDAHLAGAQIHLADRVPKEEVKLDLGPLDLQLRDFDSRGQTPFALKLDTGIGRQGQLAASGLVQVNPLKAEVQVNSKELDLRLAQAYLSPYMHLELRSGLLASELKVELQGGDPLALGIAGRAEVTQLHTLDTLKERDFVRWRQLVLDGIEYRHGERLSIAKVNLAQPYARVIVNEDLSTNIKELLVERPATPTPTPAEPREPLAIQIGEIAIADGSANFADFSLTPNFATAIQQLNGHIGSVDNRSRQPASVAIKGKVDRYAPVNIEGSLTPFDPLQRLDIAASFKGVELTTLTPYSGKFAGYRIRKGRLNLDLHYRIHDGKLNAENKLVLEQLQLGEQVDSPDAVDLPVRLAVALLKDSQGRIDISLPVQGDLNNPEFRVAPIVWKTLRNLMTRAVRAPFKLLAGLAGGRNIDLSQIEFAAGSAELDEQAQRALDTLAEALNKRPELRLEIQGTSAQASDGPLLAEQRLERELQNTYYRLLQRRGDQVPAEASELVVPEEEKGPLLEGIYRARLTRQPPQEWAELGGEQRSAKLREALLAHWSQSVLLPRRLAQARAAMIKDYLVERGELAAERAYLLDAELTEAQSDGRVATSLQLDSE